MSEIVVSKSESTGGLIRVDATRVGGYLKRLHDIGNANNHTAPALLAALNEGWMYVNGLALEATRELTLAKTDLKQRGFQVLLETTDEVLQKLGHARASKEVRQAVVETDAEYVRLRKITEGLEVLQGWLRLQAEGLANGFSAVKRIVGSQQLPFTR